MKKLISLLLAAAMLLGLSACGGSAEPAQTTAAATEPAVVETAAPTEASIAASLAETTAETTAPAPIVSLAEQMLQAEDTVEVFFDTAEEYEKTLQTLGYNEIVFNYYCITEFGTELAIRPEKLTYNDKVFRLDFSYMDNTFSSNGMSVWCDGWVLYGTVADSNENIAGFNFDDYQYADFMSAAPPRVPKATQDLDIFPQMDEWICSTFENDEVMTEYAYFASYYYPSTGRLYNFVHTPENANDGSFNIPRILKGWNETLVDAWVEQGLPTFSFSVHDIDGHETSEPVHTGYHFYCFEPGMTLVDWAKSPYNMDGWSYKESENILVSWDGEYVVLIGYDKNGQQYTLDDHLYGHSYSVPVMKKETYDLFLQSKNNQ